VSNRGRSKPLALTLGEPAGIGPDITISAWQRRGTDQVPPFLFLGSAALIERRAGLIGAAVPTVEVPPEEATAAFGQALPCLEGSEPVIGEAGRPDQADGPAIIASIRKGVELIRSGAASALVTNPIHKKALNSVGFPFPGHTEFLAALAREVFAVTATPVMMLAGPDLKVVPVTVHIPLSDVPLALTPELIIETGTIVAHELTARFRIAEPRLAVSGLNPHAGEAGMLGKEDEAVVRPAVEALQAAGISAIGPLSADTMFHPAARATYDAALCMYHDQALIPIKTLAFDEGVNVTLGLPFIRTSPDHGTALSLVGSGKAHPTSLIAALRLADTLARGDVHA
jgi:4-hydroxythreonine-4-phosphate dehydrogenase